MRSTATPANELGYQLFTTAGRTVNWGSTVGTDTVLSAGTGVGTPVLMSVHGRIQGSAATISDYKVASRAASVAHGVDNIVGGGLVHDRGQGPFDACRTESLAEGLRPCGIAAGDDEGMATEGAREWADLSECALAKNNPGRGGEFEAHEQASVALESAPASVRC